MQQKCGRIGVLVLLVGMSFIAPRRVTAADAWHLPQTIADENTTVSFAVDSTWHLVEGKTSGLRGKIWLANSSDPLSIRIEATLPVDRFDTARESRDEKLRKVMHAEQFSEVSFVGLRAALREGECQPTKLSEGTVCRIDIDGELRIGAVSKSVVLPVVVSKTPRGFHVEGGLSLDWADYGVDDPSILIAKLDRIVRVRVAVELVQRGS